MTNPESSPSSFGKRITHAFGGLLRTLVLLLIVSAVSAAVSYEVFQWRAAQLSVAATSQEESQWQQVRDRQDALDQKMQQVEKAAADAQLLLSENGQTLSLDAKLKEIDTLKLDLKKTQDQVDDRFKSIEAGIAEQVAAQGKESAEALSVELRWKSLLIKAQGEVLLAEFDYSQGNRGLAKDSLGSAETTLQEALAVVPDATKPAVKQTLDAAGQAKSALILEQAAARDSLNLLWHQINDLIASKQGDTKQ